MSKIIASLFVLFISCMSYCDDSTKEIDDYTHKLVSEALSILNSPTKEAREAKLTKARVLMQANLDFDSMAKRSLGTYRKELSPEQIQTFVAAYKNYVSRSYTNLIKDYTGTEKDITIVSTQHLDQDDFRVNMSIVNNEQPINVSYLVRKVGNSFKVFDVVTEGLSLVDSQQTDFVGMINNKGFPALIEFLKSKS